MADISSDIKGNRLSHTSSPIASDTEFHLRRDEIGLKNPKTKGLYYVCFPVMCVSDNEPGKTKAGEDVNMARFIQVGVAKVIEDSKHPQDVEKGMNRIASKLAKETR